MTPDGTNVSQWLAEIQSLQQQVAELQKECDRAYASADNLRQLYDAEAQQRRKESETHTRQVNKLKKALADLQSPQAGDAAQMQTEITRVRSNRSVEQLQAQLISAKQQCEQLKTMLTDEQTAHAQTRESLTAALGDAVDLLTKERTEIERTETTPNS